MQALGVSVAAKEAKWRRLAIGRTEKVLNALDVLGRLAAAENLWSPGDVDAIFAAIWAKAKKVQLGFEENGKPFQLP